MPKINATKEIVVKQPTKLPKDSAPETGSHLKLVHGTTPLIQVAARQ